MALKLCFIYSVQFCPVWTKQERMWPLQRASDDLGGFTMEGDSAGSFLSSSDSKQPVLTQRNGMDSCLTNVSVELLE